MNKIDLSIIVLSYNQEKYIEKTIKSIVEQKTKYTFEILVGDDCSTDNTRVILKELAAKYSTIRLLLNETNYGVVKNYCNALHEASGRYIMECGGDDYWMQGKIERQLDYMSKNDCSQLAIALGSNDRVRSYLKNFSYLGKHNGDFDQLNSIACLQYIYNTRAYATDYR